MGDIYIDKDFTERVRNILHVDNAEFSDELINSADFRGMAELSVKKAVPLWQDILNGTDEEKAVLLRSCVVLECALSLIPSLRRGDRKIEQTTNSKVEYFENGSANLLEEWILQRLKGLYSELNGEDTAFAFCGLDITNADKRYSGGGFV